MPRKKERKNARKTRVSPLSLKSTLREIRFVTKKHPTNKKKPNNEPGVHVRPQVFLLVVLVLAEAKLRVSSSHIFVFAFFASFFVDFFLKIFALFAPFFSYFARCFFYQRRRRRVFVVRLGLLAEATFARKKMTPLVHVVVLKEGLLQKQPSPREEEESPNKRG
jgi:hypothetical protein